MIFPQKLRNIFKSPFQVISENEMRMGVTSNNELQICPTAYKKNEGEANCKAGSVKTFPILSFSEIIELHDPATINMAKLTKVQIARNTLSQTFPSRNNVHFYLGLSLLY